MPKSRDRIRVSPPKSKRCGSRGKGRSRYTKAQLVALAKASGVNPRQLIDDLCEELGIQPPVNSVEIPKKKCGTRVRGEDRYTREEVRVLAKYRKIPITGKTMDQLCDELGITLDEDQMWKITLLDEKLPEGLMDTQGVQLVKAWSSQPGTLTLYYADDIMSPRVDYSVLYPVINTLLKLPHTFMIPLNDTDTNQLWKRLSETISSGEYKVVRMLNTDPTQNTMEYGLYPEKIKEIQTFLQKLEQASFQKKYE